MEGEASLIKFREMAADKMPEIRSCSDFDIFENLKMFRIFFVSKLCLNFDRPKTSLNRRQQQQEEEHYFTSQMNSQFQTLKVK